MTDQELAAIEARYSLWVGSPSPEQRAWLAGESACDVPHLVAEVRRLRAFIEKHALDKGEMGHGFCLSCEEYCEEGANPHLADCELVALLGREPGR